LLDLGTTMGIIDKRGAFYTFNDTRLGQGRENSKEFLEGQPAIAQQIEDAIRGKATFAPVQLAGPDDEDEAGDEE
jgi:recombination protein RecA